MKIFFIVIFILFASLCSLHSFNDEHINHQYNYREQTATSLLIQSLSIPKSNFALTNFNDDLDDEEGTEDEIEGEEIEEDI